VFLKAQPSVGLGPLVGKAPFQVKRHISLLSLQAFVGDRRRIGLTTKSWRSEALFCAYGSEDESLGIRRATDISW
jgi:hypothetical protein